MNKKNQHTVLLIDSDKKLASQLKTYFAKFDLQLISESLPSRGMKKFKKIHPDLVILDVMLPEINGFELCKKLRSESNIPIIILTARGGVSDRVTGLKIGADDYIPKPFEQRELVARIEIILSRINDSPLNSLSNNKLTFNKLTINRNSHEVYIENTLVDLTTKEYALLLLMCENLGETYSRDDIMSEISGIDSELYSRSVDILISRLRNKIKPLDYIKTVWGIGYKFTDND